MKTYPAVAGIALLIAAPALASGPGWTVDQSKSRIGFSGTQTGTPFKGAFGRYKAEIAFDPAHPEAAHIGVVIDLGSAATGDKQRDTALPGSDWFDVAHAPLARFVSTRVVRAGGNAYVANGNLTLRGVTRPVRLPFTLVVTGATAHATGHAQLLRSAFGVGQGAWASGQWVALQVGVDIDITATRAG